MLTVGFFLYNFISLYISSSISLKLRDSKDVEKVSYINNVALLLIVAILVMTISTALTLKFGCEAPRANINYNFFALVAIIILNLFLNGMYIAMVASSEFKNVPKDVKQLIITALVLNIVGTLIGIGIATYQAHKASSTSAS